MKRILTVVMALLMIATLDASAYRGHRTPVRRQNRAADGLGVNFGYVHSWYSTVDWASDERTSSSGLNGFHIGLNKDFILVPYALFIQTGLDYGYLNDSREESVAALRVVGDREEHYLKLPVRLKYSIPVTDRIAISLDAGPSLVCGLSSKLSYRTRISGSSAGTYVYNYHKGNAKVEGMPAEIQSWATAQQPGYKFRRFDAQLGVAAGAEFFDIFEVKFGFDFGLVNKVKGDLAQDFKTHRNQFNLTLGLRF